MHYARRPLIGSASGGVYRHETRTSTKIRPDHGSALRVLTLDHAYFPPVLLLVKNK